jgi:hypothetical protein
VDTGWIPLQASELKVTNNRAMMKPKVKENTKERRRRVDPDTRSHLWEDTEVGRTVISYLCSNSEHG